MISDHIDARSSSLYDHQLAMGEQNFTKNQLIPPLFQLSPPSKSTHFVSIAMEHEFFPNQISFFPHHLVASDAIAPAPTPVEEVVRDPNLLAAKGFMKEIVCPNPAPVRMRRSSNKERHSKIFTSQGLRDRRMRLSVDVARKFFALQDKLGFDKASKTVGWLLKQSKAAIQELPRNCLSQANYNNLGYAYPSFESEDDLSGIDRTLSADHLDQYQKTSSATTKGKRQKSTNYSIDRESRAVARAKARERTREKMNGRVEKPRQIPNMSTGKTTQLRSLAPLGFSAEASSSRNVADVENSMESRCDASEASLVGFSTFNDMTNFFSENWDLDVIENCYMHL